MELSLEESLRLTVAALMQATGESQRSIAAVLGLTQTQVSRRQSGAVSWSLRDVDVLAGHYGIGGPDLLSGPTRACESLPADRRRSAKAETSRSTKAETRGAVR
ncbi:helix-turn-helix domain-containing protein [Streptomyces sp. H27-D2]|uniref:helix-turn-helix domain-containing protein n=1 Tax=Streptomyces sp. H27-D2 TaxID=3046304 RepID=UPI002DBCED97|nr:helix-turn-helix domain-containing protein [Streptomyces sp. H27-D2]MEC4020504.1 helix-turn-helix domain-containing protein [Streptomyces sp. H27-D2]